MSSRWSERHAHVREAGDPDALPAGFRAAGVAAGLKPSGGPDLGSLAVWMRHRFVSRTSRTPGGTAASSTNGSSS